MSLKSCIAEHTTFCLSGHRHKPWMFCYAQ
jgi:hypothetical protein